VRRRRPTVVSCLERDVREAMSAQRRNGAPSNAVVLERALVGRRNDDGQIAARFDPTPDAERRQRRIGGGYRGVLGLPG
jgi:hypothetical protein